MSATFWDNFDHLLSEAETAFVNGDIDGAAEKWNAYFKITALSEWQEIAEEAKKIWIENRARQIASLDDLYTLWEKIRRLEIDNKISRYCRNLFIRYITNTYKERFAEAAGSGEKGKIGVFEYLCGNYSEASALLKENLQKNVADVSSRIYLGWCYLEQKDQKSAIAVLTQNLFLAADELTEDDMYLSQFKMLYGKLHSQRANHQEAAWLLTFESWYRNWLFLEEDESFYQLMRQKEIDERIFQVKYYLHERYRHFARCLFIAEYNRQFNKKNQGPILEQENYMQRLDPQLFEKYRKKRKALNN
jgi:hypothetical protein